MRIALVEDSEVIAEHLRALVSDVTGAEVVAEAKTASGAVQAIVDSRPDLVILDLTLAQGSGIDVLRQVELLHQAVKIIVLTNKIDLQYRKRCMALGADYFLDKSREFGRLPGLLQELAGGP